MKKILPIIILAILTLQLNAQDINQIVFDPDVDREILIGLTDEDGLANPIFVEDWLERVDSSIPNKKITKKLKRVFKKNPDISIKVFYASWCGDSKQYMPDFVKLMHDTKMQNTIYYGLDRYKEMSEYSDLDISLYNIELVPTFIIYREDSEIGRIIESPSNSLEEDIYDILKGK